MAYRCCPTDWLSSWSSLTPLRLLAPLLLCPLSQPSRYFYLADPAANTVTDKESSELWAFSAAILPWIDNCDADVAATVRANADITVATSPMSDGYVAAKASLESVYECMGITCAQVGGILEEGTTNFVTGFEPCTDAGAGAGTTASDSAADGTFAAMAGYSPGGSVFSTIRVTNGGHDSLVFQRAAMSAVLRRRYSSRTTHSVCMLCGHLCVTLVSHFETCFF